MIVVLVQHGVILCSSKERGIIVGMEEIPLAIHVEQGEPIHVFINTAKNLYRRVDSPDELVYEPDAEILQKFYEDFLDKLTTQLYSGEKWQYLFKGDDEHNDDLTNSLE